ncbi:MAG TPA: hypothetical protein DDY31_16690 [Lachnospiraceae bacterium]|nr:hypothetical protein [Lachnospiraceae bacterium]
MFRVEIQQIYKNSLIFDIRLFFFVVMRKNLLLRCGMNRKSKKRMLQKHCTRNFPEGRNGTMS